MKVTGRRTPMLLLRARPGSAGAGGGVSRGRRVGMVFGLAAAACALAGCDLPWSSTPVADEPEVRSGELAVVGDRPCPPKLPVGDDPSGHGFGTEEAASEVPSLLEAQEAWVCRYEPVDVKPRGNAGAVYEWRRAGRPDPVAAGDLPALEAALDDLAPPEESDRLCTSDLGPRWMVTFAHDGDLTGVVVDGYGCRDVRLTDDPYGTPPGADGQEGTVAGVLDGGAGVLEAVGVRR